MGCHLSLLERYKSKNYKIRFDDYGLTPIMRIIVNHDQYNDKYYGHLIKDILIDNANGFPDNYIERCLFLAVENKNKIATNIILSIPNINLNYKSKNISIIDLAEKNTFMINSLDEYYLQNHILQTSQFSNENDVRDDAKNEISEVIPPDLNNNDKKMRGSEKTTITARNRRMSIIQFNELIDKTDKYQI